MEGFWAVVVKACGTAGVAAFLGFIVYPQIITSPYLKNLTHTEVFALFGLIAVVVFGVCMALISASRKRAQGSNTINVKGSTVHGNVRAGNNTTREQK